MKLGPPIEPNRKSFPFIGSVVFQGIPIDIEQRKGDVRTGVDADGHQWATTMQAHYGEVRSHSRGAVGTAGAKGMDGDRLDVYVGPDDNSNVVVVVDQLVPTTGKRDEQKVMLGFADEAAAVACYRKQYDKPEFYGGHTVMSVDDFKSKIANPKNAGKALAKAIAALFMVMPHDNNAPRRLASRPSTIATERDDRARSGLATTVHADERTSARAASDAGGRADGDFPGRLSKAGGPYIGPRGGKWADAAHTIPWHENDRSILQEITDQHSSFDVNTPGYDHSHTHLLGASEERHFTFDQSRAAREFPDRRTALRHASMDGGRVVAASRMEGESHHGLWRDGKLHVKGTNGEWAAVTHGHEVEAKPSEHAITMEVELPLAVSDKIAHTLRALLDRFPEVGPIRVGDVGSARSETLASKANGRLLVNPRFFGDPDFWEKHKKEWDGALVNPSMEGVVIHEFGHMLAGRAKDILGGKAFNEIARKYVKKPDSPGFHESPTAYGMENDNEFEAESFSAYWHGQIVQKNDAMSDGDLLRGGMSNSHFFWTEVIDAMRNKKTRRTKTRIDKALARMFKGGPYIGPKGGKWADPAHTVPWSDTPHTFHGSREKWDALPRAYHATVDEAGVRRDGFKPRSFEGGGYGGDQHTDMVWGHSPWEPGEAHEKVARERAQGMADHINALHDIAVSSNPEAEADRHLAKYKENPSHAKHWALNEEYAQKRLADEERRHPLTAAHKAAMRYNHTLQAAHLQNNPITREDVDRHAARKTRAAVIEFRHEHIKPGDMLPGTWAPRVGVDNNGHVAIRPEHVYLNHADEMAKAGGPYIGPKGGKWADAAHTIPWHQGDAPKQSERADKSSSPAGRLRQLAADFLSAEREHMDPHSPDDTKGRCDGVARDLGRYLSERGLKSEAIEATGFKGELGHDAHDDWKKFSGADQKFLWHTVVKVGGHVIDMTAAQYGSKWGGIVVEPVADFKARWDRVKVSKGGPYIGPKGGKWADPEHTIHWEDRHQVAAAQSHAEKPKLTHEPLKWDAKSLLVFGDMKPGTASFHDVAKLMNEGSSSEARHELTVAWLHEHWHKLESAKTVNEVFAAFDGYDTLVLDAENKERERLDQAAKSQRESAVAASQSHRVATDPGRVAAPSEGKDWAAGGAMKEPVYHATMAGASIMATGLKARQDVASRGLGLGPEDTVSTTPSEQGAHRIAAVFAALAEAKKDPIAVKAWLDEHWVPLIPSEYEGSLKEIKRADAQTDPLVGVKERINQVSFVAGYTHPHVLVPRIFHMPTPGELENIGVVTAYANVDAVMDDRGRVKAGPGSDLPMAESPSIRSKRASPDHHWALHRDHGHLKDAHLAYDTENKAEQGEIRVFPEDLVSVNFEPVGDWRAILSGKIQKAGGPFIGPKGGKWADAARTVAWKERRGRPSQRPDDEGRRSEHRARLLTRLDAIEKEIRDAPREHMAIVTSDGSVHRQDGSVDHGDYVLIARHHMSQWAADGNAVMTHNHPAGGTFTPSDIRTAYHANLAEVRAVTRNGVWSFSRPEDGWQGPYEFLHDNTERLVIKPAQRAMDQHVRDHGYDHEAWLDCLVDATHKYMHPALIRKFGSDISYHKWTDRSSKARIRKAGGPYIGPRGGKWADPAHTIPWTPDWGTHDSVHAATQAISHGVGSLSRDEVKQLASQYKPQAPWSKEHLDSLYQRLPSKGLDGLGPMVHQPRSDVPLVDHSARRSDKRLVEALSMSREDLSSLLTRIAGAPAGMVGEHYVSAVGGTFYVDSQFKDDDGNMAVVRTAIDPLRATISVTNRNVTGRDGSGFGLRHLVTQCHALAELHAKPFTPKPPASPWEETPEPVNPGRWTITPTIGMLAGDINSRDYNGYYTWPQLGYMANGQGPMGESLEQLMSSREGAAWWRMNGSDIQGTFDTTPGSYSMRRLEFYARHRLASKSIQKGHDMTSLDSAFEAMLAQIHTSKLAKAFAVFFKARRGPYIGPKGGKWADAKHTVHWDNSQQPDLFAHAASKPHDAGMARHEKPKDEILDPFKLMFDEATPATKPDPTPEPAPEPAPEPVPEPTPVTKPELAPEPALEPAPAVEQARTDDVALAMQVRGLVWHKAMNVDGRMVGYWVRPETVDQVKRRDNKWEEADSSSAQKDPFKRWSMRRFDGSPYPYLVPAAALTPGDAFDYAESGLEVGMGAWKLGSDGVWIKAEQGLLTQDGDTVFTGTTFTRARMGERVRTGEVYEGRRYQYEGRRLTWEGLRERGMIWVANGIDPNTETRTHEDIIRGLQDEQRAQREEIIARAAREKNAAEEARQRHREAAWDGYEFPQGSPVPTNAYHPRLIPDLDDARFLPWVWDESRGIFRKAMKSAPDRGSWLQRQNYDGSYVWQSLVKEYPGCIFVPGGEEPIYEKPPLPDNVIQLGVSIERPPDFLALNLANIETREVVDGRFTNHVPVGSEEWLHEHGFWQALDKNEGHKGFLARVLIDKARRGEAYTEIRSDKVKGFIATAARNLAAWWSDINDEEREYFWNQFCDPERQPRVVRPMDPRQENADFKVPPGMEKFSDKGWAFHEYQRKAINFSADHAYRSLWAEEMGLGKQNPVDTMVLTPDGWREIGSVKVGDYVIGSAGKKVLVIGVYPQGVKPSYRVRFSDDSSVEAGPEHFWRVGFRRGARWDSVVLTTDQIRTRPRIALEATTGQKHERNLASTVLYLPMLSGPVCFDPAPALPIGAYALGQLIANGSLGNSTPKLTCGEIDWPDILPSLHADGIEIGHCETYGSVRHANFIGIIDKIRDLGLSVGSYGKRIPRIYLEASPADRIALLQGLMDGDGSVSKTNNRLTYHTVAAKLADDVRELVEGLGGIASVKDYDRSDEDKPTDYVVRMRLPTWAPPFRISRKASRYKPGSHAMPTRTFESVEYVRDVESVCIAVDAPDHLYVTEHCIVTHNTLQAIGLFHHLKARGEVTGMVITAPTSAIGAWEDEFAGNSNARVKIIAEATPKQRTAAYEGLDRGDFDVLVMTPYVLGLPAIGDKLKLTAASLAKAPDGTWVQTKVGPGVQGWRREGDKWIKGYNDYGTTDAITMDEMRKLKPSVEITSYDRDSWAIEDLDAMQLRRVIEKHGKKILRIGDEVHLFKNEDAARRRGFEHAICAPEGRVVGMSGTPKPNGPEDFYTIVNDITRGALGSTLEEFADRYCYVSDDKWGGILGFRPDALSELYRDNAGFLFARTTQDPDSKINLPPQHHISPRIKPDSVQTELQDGFVRAMGLLHQALADEAYARSMQMETRSPAREMLNAMADGDEGPLMQLAARKVPWDERTLLIRLKQASIAPSILDDDGSVTGDAGPLAGYESPKLQAVADAAVTHMSQNPDTGAVLFSTSVGGLYAMRKALVKRGITPEDIGVIHGGVPQKQREQIRRDLNSGKLKFVIGQTKALNTGCNMQARANFVAHIDTPWEPDVLTQSTARVHRQGQKRKVTVFRPMGSDVDALIERRVAAKIRANANALGVTMDSDRVALESMVGRGLNDGQFTDALAKTLGVSVDVLKPKGERVLTGMRDIVNNERLKDVGDDD